MLEFLSVFIYLIGYLAITMLAFCLREPVCWTYSIITLVAIIPVFIAIAHSWGGGKTQETDDSSK